MGILNVTPDSFSDGGRYLDTERAVAHAQAMAEQGADLIDVGGESTRPGAAPVPPEEELRRVLPVVRRLCENRHMVVSVDTRRAAVARAALEAGARVVNDVSALRDPEMAAVVRDFGAGVVLMHMRGEPATMQQDPRYRDVVAEVRDFLQQRVEAAVAAGVDPSAIVVDPGIGFGKTAAHNLALLRAIPQLTALGRPVLIGVSRKSIVGHLTGRPVAERVAGSVALAAIAVYLGAAVVRAHDVRETCDAVRVADTMASGAQPDGLDLG
ncbi:MAG: dihydropteroate synthase [Kiritimatiellae bacterium]|nr:dihydropteroate synthase [Kiritimatiellia bacterium]